MNFVKNHLGGLGWVGEGVINGKEKNYHNLSLANLTNCNPFKIIPPSKKNAVGQQTTRPRDFGSESQICACAKSLLQLTMKTQLGMNKPFMK